MSRVRQGTPRHVSGLGPPSTLGGDFAAGAEGFRGPSAWTVLPLGSAMTPDERKRQQEQRERKQKRAELGQWMKAVAQVEGKKSRFRVKALIPVDTVNPTKSPSRVRNVGVTALVDVKL